MIMVNSYFIKVNDSIYYNISDKIIFTFIFNKTFVCTIEKDIMRLGNPILSLPRYPVKP